MARELGVAAMYWRWLRRGGLMTGGELAQAPGSRDAWGISCCASRHVGFFLQKVRVAPVMDGLQHAEV